MWFAALFDVAGRRRAGRLCAARRHIAPARPAHAAAPNLVALSAAMGDAARGRAKTRKATLRFFKHDLFRKPASTFRDHALEEQTMIVTVFRSRLKPDVREEYVTLANRMNELARTMPGYISHKDFYANDGERVAIVEFAHEEGQRAWQTKPEHRAAQKLAREKYYTEYHIQVCTLDRESKFKLPEQAAAQTCPRRPDRPGLTLARRSLINSAGSG